MTEPAPPPVPQEPIVPGSMKSLYTHVPAAVVDQHFKDLASTWPTWESATHRDLQGAPIQGNKVRFVYNGDYGSERVLIASGRATIHPDDGSPTVTVGPGDSMHFHWGFSCVWEILEPIIQNYGYFDPSGNELAENSIECDVCGAECFEESFLFEDEMDICPKCFAADAKGAEEYVGAQYQRQGKPATLPPPKARVTPKSGSKRPKETDFVPMPDDDEDDDDDDDDSGEEYTERKPSKPKPKKPKTAPPQLPTDPAALAAAAAAAQAAAAAAAVTTAAAPAAPVPVPQPVPQPAPVAPPAPAPVPMPMPAQVPMPMPQVPMQMPAQIPMPMPGQVPMQMPMPGMIPMPMPAAQPPVPMPMPAAQPPVPPTDPALPPYTA